MNEEQIRDEARQAANRSQFMSNHIYDLKSYEDGFYEGMKQALSKHDVGGSIFWNDDKVLEFVNWYLELHKLDFRYTLENRNIIESFKNGDDTSKWH